MQGVPDKPIVRRPWYRFRLRALLVLAVLAGIGGAWYALKLQELRYERQAAEELQKLGARVVYDEAGWLPSSRKTAGTCLRQFGRWLLDAGKVLRNPAADLHIPEPDEEPLPPTPLSEEQVVAVFDTVGRGSVVDLRIRLHLEMLYSCALRNSEAVNLDVADLDLDERTVLVRNGKGGKSRLLPLLAPAHCAAADYLALRRELLQGPDTGALLLSPSGARTPKWWMQDHLYKLSRTIGFRVFPHLLRHSVAVHLLRRGADIRYIQQFLAHEDLETTKVYLRLVPGQLREDYDAAMPVFPVEPPPTAAVTAASLP